MSNSAVNDLIGKTLNRLPGIHWLAFFICAALYLVANDHQSLSYHSFNGLQWNNLVGFKEGKADSISFQQAAVISSTKPENDTHSRRAKSSTFLASSDGVILEYRAGPADVHCSLAATFIGSNQQPLHRVDLPAMGQQDWQRVRIELPSNIATDRLLSIRFEQSSSNNCWSTIRERIERVSFSKLLSLQEFFKDPLFGNILLSLFFAASILWCFTKTSSNSSSYLSVFLLLSVLSLATQLRISGYFHWDEWHALERYAHQGLPSILLPHNEHVLPLFFSIYNNEALLFVGEYLPMLVISCLLHSTIAFIIFLILESLGIQRFSSTLLTSLFTVSCLHGETLQWAFEQSLLFCHLAIFCSLLLGLRYIVSANRKYLIGASLLSMSAPLFFGNGFVIVFYWPLLFLTYLVSSKVFFTQRVLLYRGAKLFLAYIISLFVPVLFYLLNKSESGHGMDQVSFIGNISEVAYYLLVGSQLGTILRGLGFIPSVELGVSAPIVSVIYQLTNFSFLPSIRPEIVLGFIGLVASFLILIFSLVLTRRGIMFWVLGQLFIISSLLLPGLARWNLGLFQSLSLRYHYGSLFGLVLLMTPLLVYAFEGVQLKSRRARFALVFVWLHLSVQLWTASQFIYFQDNGQRHIVYINSLLEWRENIGSNSPYEGTGTKLEGLQPSYPQTLTPAKHPDDIYKVLLWLGKKRD